MFSVFRIGKFKRCSEEPQQINCILLSYQTFTWFKLLTVATTSE